MTDDDRAECWPVVKAIEQAGGLTKADDATLAEAKRLNLVKRSKGGNRYTIKGNVLKGEMAAAYGGGVTPHPSKQGHVVDAQIGPHKVRGKVTGKVGDLTVIDHHNGGTKQPIAVQDQVLEDVDRDIL
jgi:hypothetical protein